MSQSQAESWVLRWRMRRGIESAVLERASVSDLRYRLHRTTRREAVESALKHMRKNLENARESVRKNEQYVAQLEKLLAKEA
jgi:hypothetical protein